VLRALFMTCFQLHMASGASMTRRLVAYWPCPVPCAEPHWMQHTHDDANKPLTAHSLACMLCLHAQRPGTAQSAPSITRIYGMVSREYNHMISYQVGVHSKLTRLNHQPFCNSKGSLPSAPPHDSHRKPQINACMCMRMCVCAG
jgi:hypothetical protein